MKLSEEIVISGAAVVSPLGSNLEAFVAGTNAGQSMIRPLLPAGRTGESISCGSRIEGYVPQLSNRKVFNQTDRSTQMALCVMREACESAHLDVRAASDRVGVFIGSSFGGIEFSEVELYNQIFLGPRKVSAYQAIAWFYAATQGQFTIDQQIRGFAKSYVGGSNGGLQALVMAIISLLEGHCDTAIVCASEATITPFYLGILEKTGKYSKIKDPDAAYQPFSDKDTGQVPAEAAVAFVLERREQAATRELESLCRIIGFSNLTSRPGVDLFDRIYREQAQVVRADDAGHRITLFPHASGRNVEDRMEASAIGAHFSARDTRLAVPKSLVGDSLSAAGLTDLMWALLHLQGAIELSEPLGPSLLRAQFPYARSTAAVVVAKDFNNTCSAVALAA